MISSEKEFKRAMRRMILCVSKGENPYPSGTPTREDLEVLAECIAQGYLLPMSSGPVTRTMDGTPHPTFNKDVVPLKGLAFLNPDKTERRSKAALWISLGAFLISLLSNIDVIARNVTAMISYLINLV